MEEKAEHSLEMLASGLRQEMRSMPKRPRGEDYLKLIRMADACLSGYYLVYERHGATYRDCGAHIASAVEDAADIVLNAPPEYQNPLHRQTVLRYAREAREICFILLDERKSFDSPGYLPEPIKRRMQGLKS